MRLATKINIFAALIFTLLMTMVAVLTQRYLDGVFRAQMRRSLEITEQGFNLAIKSLCEDQLAKANMQSQRDVLRFSTREHYNSVLNYYLHTSQADLNVDLLEILDVQGHLLADGNRYYEPEETVLPEAGRFLGRGRSYMARRGRDIFLISAAPLDFLGKVVGYVGVGKRLNRDYLARLASMLSSEIVVLVDGGYAIGTLAAFRPPDDPGLAKLRPGQRLFRSDLHSGGTSYDFVLSAQETDGLFSGCIGIGLDRGGMMTALARSRMFLLLLSLGGLAFTWIGSYILARNIKSSIHGMEPDEIAGVLNERNAILQSTFEGIIAVDRTGLITLVNQEAQRLLPRETEALGRNIADLLPDPSIARVLGTGEAVYNQQHLLGETIVFYNTVPIKVHAEIIGAVITLRDLTEFQKVAAELMEIKSYTQALRAQSHEFINKLHTVSGLIQLGRYDQALQQLLASAQNHQEMISFLSRAFPSSDVSGILLGKYNRANELNVRFHLDPKSRMSAPSTLSETELVCIIGNLVENALESLRASDQEDKRIWVKILERAGYLIILVVDNGPGIPRGIRGKIFNRGFTTKTGQNKGLGLALVKQCVDNLRGTVVFHSDRLTAFLVRIPIVRDGGASGFAQGPDRRGQSISA